MTALLKNQKQERRSLSFKIAGWAQVALLGWMMAWGDCSSRLEYVAVGTARIDCAIAQPEVPTKGEPSGSERVNPTQCDGYGALPGTTKPSALIAGANVASQLGWRGHYIDPTGFYYMGARNYAPDSGTFLSPDPLGHSASMDLYSYCNGDPVNNFDSDGRFGVGALTGQSYNSASSLGAIFGGSTLITQSTQMASSLVQSYQGNLQMFDGNQYDAINATVNPAYTAISKYNEAADGIGYSYNNLGNSLSTSQRVFSGFQSAVGAVSTVGAGFAGASLLDGALSVASGGVPASYFQSTRLEVQALQQQGLSTSEAFSQIRSFNAGNADGYSFHFTTAQKAQGILNDGFIKPSTGGVYGSGVYAGTTPTPGFLLKNTPFAGWGLGGEGANVRIPFQTVQQPVVPPLPPQTVIFRNPVKIGE